MTQLFKNEGNGPMYATALTRKEHDELVKTKGHPLTWPPHHDLALGVDAESGQGIEVTKFDGRQAETKWIKYKRKKRGYV